MKEPTAPIVVRMGLVGPELPPGGEWGVLALDKETWDGGSQWRWLRPVFARGDEGWLGDGHGPLKPGWITHEFYLAYFGFQGGLSPEIILMPFLQNGTVGDYAVIVQAVNATNEEDMTESGRDLDEKQAGVATPLAEGLEVTAASTYPPPCYGCSETQVEEFFGPLTRDIGACSLPPPCRETWIMQHAAELNEGISYFFLHDARYNGTWSRVAKVRDLDWSAEGLLTGPFSFEGTSNPMQSSGVESSVAGSGAHIFSLTLNVISGNPKVFYYGWSVDFDVEALTGVPMEEFDRHQTELLPASD